MDLVIFNAILYLSTAVIYFYKRRVIDIGFILLSIYSFVAIMAIPCHYFLNVLWQRNITLFPFLYLYIVLLLFFRAYLLPTDELCLRIKERNLNKLKLLAVIYIMSSVVVVILLLPQVFANDYLWEIAITCIFIPALYPKSRTCTKIMSNTDITMPFHMERRFYIKIITRFNFKSKSI